MRGGRKKDSMDRTRCRKHWRNIQPQVWREELGAYVDRDPLPAEVVLGRRFSSLLDRFDNDVLYRKRCTEEPLNWTRDDMAAVEILGRSEPRKSDMPYYKREEFWGDRYEHVSSQRGGRNTQRRTESSKVYDPLGLVTSTSRQDQECWEGHYIRIAVRNDRKRKKCSWCNHMMESDEEVAYCRECQAWYCCHCLDRPKPKKDSTQQSSR